jgi:type III secretion protein C
MCRLMKHLPILLTLVFSTLAGAADIPWRTKQFKYIAEQKKLTEFLREFALSQGITTVISHEVDGVVNAKFDLSPRATLELIAGTYGLIWYYDGNVLHIYSSNEAKSEILRLSAANVAKLQQNLKQLKIADRRYPIAYDETENTVLVSGPKRYVELVQQAARYMDENQSRRSSSEVRVFHLQYAWAEDYRLNQGEKEVILSGVASTLMKLFSGNSKPQTLQATKFTPPRRAASTRTKLKGSDVELDVPGKLEPPELESGGDAPDPSLPQFEADGRMNAILVRDVPERMQYYAELIRSLDVPPGLVEIEAQIMDVSSDALETLGVDWRLGRGKMDLQIRNGTSPPLTFGDALTDGTANTIIPPATSPVGGVFSALSGEAGRFLLARISALEQTGRAKFVANPKVMTLDNVEAILENINTLHVRIAGVQAVNLFDVSAGTSLRVTPHIVREANGRRFKLAVKIEDGKFTGQNVDAIPTVQRSSIGTQAFIAEGESLLIAGYTAEEETNGTTGVPGLSRIPVVGNLFKRNEKVRTRVERLFMLTPRLVGDLAETQQGGGAQTQPAEKTPTTGQPAARQPSAAAMEIAPAVRPGNVTPSAKQRSASNPSATQPRVAPPPESAAPTESKDTRFKETAAEGRSNGKFNILE